MDRGREEDRRATDLAERLASRFGKRRRLEDIAGGRLADALARLRYGGGAEPHAVWPKRDGGGGKRASGALFGHFRRKGSNDGLRANGSVRWACRPHAVCKALRGRSDGS